MANQEVKKKTFPLGKMNISVLFIKVVVKSVNFHLEYSGLSR